MSPERRKTLRRRLLRRGNLVFRNGTSRISCVVMDMHHDGAKLRVIDWMGVPGRIELRIENGTTHLAEVRYRTFDTIGVQFVNESAA